MKYLAATGSSLIGRHPELAIMIGPRSNGMTPIREGRPWAGDNDAFHGRFTEQKFFKHLNRLTPFIPSCLFITCPDVRLDCEATLRLWDEWSPYLAFEGFPVAYVAQDGCQNFPLPDADRLFIGGGDEWRAEWMGEMIRRGTEAGMAVHVGRVNSLKRMRLTDSFGASWCDGTYIKYRGKERGLREVGQWLDKVNGTQFMDYLETA